MDKRNYEYHGHHHYLHNYPAFRCWNWLFDVQTEQQKITRAEPFATAQSLKNQEFT